MNAVGLYYNEMELAIKILNGMYPHAPRLQATSLGIYCPNETMPTFKSKHGNFVQIFYLPDHWVVGTNMFSSACNEIYWYDSRPKDFVRTEAIVQLSSILRRR